MRDKTTGQLAWIPVFTEGTPFDPDGADKARDAALVIQQVYNDPDRLFVPAVRGETNEEIFQRWNKSEGRQKEFPNQVHDDAQMWRDHVPAWFKALPPRATTKDHYWKVVGEWNKEAAKPRGERRFGPKRARNIDAVCRAFFRDVEASDDETIRLSNFKNPTVGVKPPKMSDGDGIRQQLFRVEWDAVMNCPYVPVVNAQLWAVLYYTMTRIGEGRVLETEHVSVTHRFVRIVQAADRQRGRDKTGATKRPKNNTGRVVTMEENIAPLFEHLIAKAIERNTTRLFPDRPKGLPKGNQHHRYPTFYVPGTSNACEVFREDVLTAFMWAGIPIRPELFDESDRDISIPLGVHDLRAMGITGRHARNDRELDSPKRIQRECGHADESTNDIYVRDLRGVDPFPPLPPRLLERTCVDVHTDAGYPDKFSKCVRGQRHCPWARPVRKITLSLDGTAEENREALGRAVAIASRPVVETRCLAARPAVCHEAFGARTEAERGPFGLSELCPELCPGTRRNPTFSGFLVPEEGVEPPT